MSKHTNYAQRLRTLAINIRWADEPLSAMSLRLAKAASDPRSFRQDEELWPDGPPNVQLGSLSPVPDICARLRAKTSAMFQRGTWTEQFVGSRPKPMSSVSTLR